MNRSDNIRTTDSPSARRSAPVWLLAIAREHPRISLPLAAMACVDLVLVGAALILQSFFTIRLFYGFNTVLVPITFAAMAVDGFVRWNRRPYERVALRLAAVFAVIAAGLTAFRVYATHIEPYRLHVRTVTIRSTHVTQPLRILHISDIQSNVVGPYDERVFRTMRELNPDLILFTGDLLQPQPPATMAVELPKMVALLSTLSPRYGLWGVMGDTDWRLPPDLVAANRQSVNNLGGLRLLVGDSVEIPTPAGTVRLLGLSNPQSIGREPRPVVDPWLTKGGANDLTVLLGHHPDYILSVQDLPIDLCLAGHTHGGQVRIPGLGPIVTLSKIPRAWSRGFHETGRTRLNVSTGIGVEHMEGVQPIRVLCPPELVLIEIVPAAGPADAGSVIHEEPGMLGKLTGAMGRAYGHGSSMDCRGASPMLDSDQVHPVKHLAETHESTTAQVARPLRGRAESRVVTARARRSRATPAQPTHVCATLRDTQHRRCPCCDTSSPCSHPPPHDIVSRVNTVPQHPELS